MTKSPTPNSPKQFEAALEELRILVERMEQGQQPLENAVADFEQGMALVKNCEQALSTAAQRIEKVMQQQGELLVEEMDPAAAKERDKPA